MKKRILVLAGLAAIVAAVLVLGGRTVAPPDPSVRIGDVPKRAGEGPSRDRAPTLYCEFYNFVGRRPKVGFTFAVAEEASRPVFLQANQLEMDGTRADFAPDAPRPAWAFDDAQVPATLTSPDGAITINLYAYDRTRSGGAWFEAGLRSVQYLNLDGKCRQGAA